MARVAALDTRELGAVEREEGGGHRLRQYAYRPYLQGGSVTMDPTGERIYAVSSSTGELVVLDAATLAVQRRSRVCDRPEQIVVAPEGKAFATCRGDGDVIAIEPNGTVAARRNVDGEPFGIALSPFGNRLLVTTANVPRALKLSTDTLELQWHRRLPPAPRGIAISANGERATVAHLSGPWVSVLDVATGHSATAPLPNARDGWPSELFDGAENAGVRRVAGGAFAVAASPGGTRAFVPYLLKNDGAEVEDFIPGCYANGAQLPMAASVAALDFGSGLVRRPLPLPAPPGQQLDADFEGISNLGLLGVVRAAFHDPVRSRLYAVGEASNLLASFDTSKADPTASPLAFHSLPGAAKGVVVDRHGRRAFVHLALSDELVVVELDTGTTTQVTLAESAVPELVARGRRLFHAANDGRLTSFAGVSCSSCHLEGRSDGVTWRLDGKPLQTPALSGRSFADGALRWHGDSPTLAHAVGEAVKRLGGTGLGQEDMSALEAFLRSGALEMSARPAKTTSAERGAEVFAEAGCTSCHDPERDYSDGQMHEVRKGRYRTPSLRGLAASAPYYHDGSARSLAVLVGAHEKGNPMGQGGALGVADLRALELFLQSL